MNILVQCNSCDRLKPISKYNKILCSDCEYEDWVVNNINLDEDKYKSLHNVRYQ